MASNANFSRSFGGRYYLTWSTLSEDSFITVCLEGLRKSRQRSTPSALHENTRYPRWTVRFSPTEVNGLAAPSVVDDWDRALGSESAVHACFIDMAKAFGRVDSALLSHVLSTLGVSGIELRWFESYLHEWSVCTVVEQHKSPFARISSGVPQGSVLGPQLFIVYYRRLPSVVSSSCAMFADDTLMYDHCSGNDESPCFQIRSHADHR